MLTEAGNISHEHLASRVLQNPKTIERTSCRGSFRKEAGGEKKKTERYPSNFVMIERKMYSRKLQGESLCRTIPQVEIREGKNLSIAPLEGRKRYLSSLEESPRRQPEEE